MDEKQKRWVYDQVLPVIYEMGGTWSDALNKLNAHVAEKIGHQNEELYQFLIDLIEVFEKDFQGKVRELCSRK